MDLKPIEFNNYLKEEQKRLQTEENKEVDSDLDQEIQKKALYRKIL